MVDSNHGLQGLDGVSSVVNRGCGSGDDGFSGRFGGKFIRSLGRSFSGFAQAVRDCALFLFPGGDAGRRCSTPLFRRGCRNDNENQLEECIKNRKTLCRLRIEILGTL